MTAAAAPIRNVDYGVTEIRKFNIHQLHPSGDVALMEVDGRIVTPTERFWTSLCVNYSNQGLSKKLFNLFSHAEVFQRLHDRLGGNGKERLGFAIEESSKGVLTLLGVRSPEKALVTYSQAQAVVGAYALTNADGSKMVAYGNGVVTSTHSPSRSQKIEIAGDEFAMQYVTETPIDGYGKPLTYLMLWRQVCSNGSIGYAKAFRSEIAMGRNSDNPAIAIERNLQSFNNDEGFSALADRFRQAACSFASVQECYNIYGIIRGLDKAGKLKVPGHHTEVAELAAKMTMAKGLDSESLESAVGIQVSRAYRELTGDPCFIYQLTSTEALSERKRRVLPTKAKVYDLINFATEIATHYTDVASARKLHAAIGQMISHEYDLEGTGETYGTFQDFFMEATGGAAEEGQQAERSE